jgi:ornithine cyclodeaminase
MTTLRYLDAATLRKALPMGAAIDAIEGVMRAAAAGDAAAPVRTVRSIARPGREDFVFLVMPGTWDPQGAAAAKVISYVPDNPAAGRATVQGLAVLLDVDTGSPRLIVDASTLTTIRTGAVIGLATRYLAREECGVLGVIGTGGIAADLVAGVAEVRPPGRLLVNDARPAAAAAFAERIPFDAEVVEDNDEIARNADILITATSSLQPITTAGTVRPGTHINAVGNFSPTGREIDGATVAAAGRWVDDIENAMEEAGEILLAAAEGLIPAGLDGIAGDLQGLVTGSAPARTRDDEITLFKTVGTALSDVAGLAAAAAVAEERELGVKLG